MSYDISYPHGLNIVAVIYYVYQKA